MADAGRRTMTPEEFFDWQSGQDELYELVDGHPVPRHRMMTGASMQHDRATVNIIVSFGNQLRGKPCRSRSSWSRRLRPQPPPSISPARWKNTSGIRPSPTSSSSSP